MLLEELKKLDSPVKPETIHDYSGLRFLEVVGTAYNRACLSRDEAFRVNEAGGLADLIADYIAKHRSEKPPLLNQVARLSAGGSKHFVVDGASLKKAKIGWTNSIFDQFFLGKVEEDIEATIIAIYNLNIGSLDAPIRKELGSRYEEITLAHFFDLLAKQSKGQKGHLLINGYANVAYIRDKNDKLCAVFAYWGFVRNDWDVGAVLVEALGEWFAGIQIISRGY